jgi:hypothetical protein
VKRICVCIAAIVAASGVVQASGIIACSGVANSSNSCDTSHLSTFGLQYNWDSVLSTTQGSVNAPLIDGTVYNNATWFASQGSLDLTISGQSLIRADNYAMTHTVLGWTYIPGFTPLTPSYRFTGNFDALPDTGFTTSGVGLTVGPYGEGLLGSYNAGTFVIGANAILTSFGFRVSAITTTLPFNVTINLFGSSDGSGTPLETLTANGLSGGGNCSSLTVLTNGMPTPCNTAPFIFVSTTGGIHSFSISTSDSTGFYIDALDVTAAPEPATLLFTGGGLVGLAFFIRRRRAAASRR